MSSDPTRPDSPAIDPANRVSTPPAESADRSKKRKIRVGSQRDETAAPQDDVPTKSPEDLKTADDVSAAPPSQSLSEDLEAEIKQALGDSSLDELVDGENATGLDESAWDPGVGLEPDSRHQAEVVKIHREDVFFALGGRHEGVVSLKQFSEPPECGATMEVVVLGLNESDGLYELTIPGATVAVGDWSDIAEGTVVEARVTGHNKGGLECQVNNIRGFIPASQISLYRVENLAEYIDQKLLCVVTEANPQRRNLVLSHRSVLERERNEAKEELLEELDVGQTRDGIVRKILDFGAFVDLGGMDGLVHVSKMSWDRVAHPSDVLQEGQRIQVKVERIDRATGKISLSYRDTLENPWSMAESKYPVSSVVTGTVSRIADFGAFVRLESGVEGLIHISELSHQRVSKVSNVVTEGEQVEVKVLSVDPQSQRIGLSLKSLEAAPASEDNPKGTDVASRRKPTDSTRKGSLKGGTNRSSGGEQFGLKW